MVSKYFSVTARPTIPIASLIQSNKSDLAFSAGDLVFDWHAFDIPKGAAKLVSVSMMVRMASETIQTDRDLLIYFAKSDDGGTAPTSLGTENATADGEGYYNNLLGYQLVDVTEYDNRLDKVSLAT